MESALPKHRDAVSNKTLQELFIARHGCTPRQFRRRVFWRSLHWQALFLAPLLLPARHFSADFELIGACGSARSLDAIREEIQAFRHDPRNAGWLRRRARIRVSARKLLQMARRYQAD
jgi:hypothetical protein